MRMIKDITFAATLLLAALVSIGTGHSQDIKIGAITIEHPWSRQPPNGGSVAAGFMKITNTGSEDDRLVKITADISGTVQIHNMKMDGNVMKMEELPDGVVIPAGETVELKPRSLHIMFMELTAQPMEGEMIKGTLVFEKAGSVDIEYEIMSPTAGMAQ